MIDKNEAPEGYIACEEIGGYLNPCEGCCLNGICGFNNAGCNDWEREDGHNVIFSKIETTNKEVCVGKVEDVKIGDVWLCEDDRDVTIHRVKNNRFVGSYCDSDGILRSWSRYSEDLTSEYTLIKRDGKLVREFEEGAWYVALCSEMSHPRLLVYDGSRLCNHGCSELFPPESMYWIGEKINLEELK